MEKVNPSSDFDRYYYLHGCGRSYQRDDEWLSFFDKISKEIIKEVQPKTVLDAGCAWGFLVEGLIHNGVQAWGIDISEYAIQNVAPDIKSYCWVGSITKPFPQRYDLIVSIEVVEHLPQGNSELAIRNICQFTDDVLFSSTPFDYKEATHYNVQPPEYWAEQFARNGFFRDVDFDASFISPWATRFRRGMDPTHRILRNYERKYWQLWKENTDLRDLTKEMRSELSKNEQEIQNLNHRIQIMLNTRTWRFLQKVRSARLKVIPPGSRRDHIARILFMPFLSNKTQTPNQTEQYPLWVARNEPGPAELLSQGRAALADEQPKLISIVTPVYNPPPYILRETIESVKNQTYPYWEWCLVDGNSPNPEIRRVLSEIAAIDSRIRVKYLDKNEGISRNSNVALEMVQGEYVFFLDHDDLVSRHTLLEVAQVIKTNPSVDFIYFDEDKVDETGKIRRDPLFKPDWSPEMLISANYLTHPVIRKNLLDRIGGFNPDFDGTQDWDLVFRCLELTDKVIHIPKVLYHWRQIGGSTAADFNAKAYVFDRQLKAIQDHLTRLGLESPCVEFSAPGIVRARWQTKPGLISIIIPTKDHPQDLQKCISSILKTTSIDYEIILVDNGSTDTSTLSYYDSLKSHPKVHTIPFLEPFNYSKANNLGARQANGDLLLFINNDVEAVSSDWLEELTQWAQRPEVGVVGGKLLYPDGSIQHAGVVIGMGGHADHIFCHSPEGSGGIFGSTEWYRNYSAVTAACMMVRKDVFDQVKGFDEAFRLVYGDIDFCLRVNDAGYRNVYTPFARLIHHEGKTRSHSYPAEDMRLACDVFKARIAAGDPYFNPNLSYAVQAPSLRPENEEDRLIRLHRMVGSLPQK